MCCGVILVHTLTVYCFFLTMEVMACSSEYRPSFICTVGTLLNSSCENTSLTKNRDIYVISDELSKEDVELLSWRTNNQYCEKDTICSHHLCYFLKYFEKTKKPVVIHFKDILFP